MYGTYMFEILNNTVQEYSPWLLQDSVGVCVCGVGV